MKLGISSYAYGWAVGTPQQRREGALTVFDLLDKAAALGVSVLQIADNLPLHALPDAELEALGKRAAEAGVQLEMGTRGMAPEHLRAYLALAERFGARILRVVVDTATHHPDEHEVIQTLAPLMPAFERAGVSLAVENHDRFPAERLRRIMEGVGSPAIGICLDTANSLGAQEGIRHVAEVLAPWVVNLHVKDFAIRRLPHLMGFLIEGRPAGGGDLDIPWLLDFVRDRVPRDVNAILELWPPPEADRVQTLAKEEAWVRASVAYLRGLIPAR